ncbi:MAG: hypothetical protein JRJ77_07670, partial [Deltaproteobacteria bacterium]|nr:hypothetical protein [Deltaproteobacteria bacterium]
MNNFPEFFRIPLADWVDALMDWLLSEFAGLFDAILVYRTLFPVVTLVGGDFVGGDLELAGYAKMVDGPHYGSPFGLDRELWILGALYDDVGADRVGCYCFSGCWYSYWH